MGAIEVSSRDAASMNSALRLAIDGEKLREFCRRWSISELAVFGSALRDDFGPDSDVDFLASFFPEANWSLLDHVRMQDELSEVVGRPVDLLTRSAVEKSRNPIRRRAILESAQVLHVDQS
jgi:predicted nucleotidyltransferase